MSTLFSKKTLKLLGRSGYLWLVINILTSALVAVGDYAIAIVSQVLLKNFAFDTPIVGQTDIFLSRWLSNWQLQLSSLLLIICFITLVRAVAQFAVYHSLAVIEEIVKTRLRLLSIYEILKSKSKKFVSASETNTKIGEIYNQTAAFTFIIINITSNLVQTLVLFSAMIYIAWKESILAFIAFILIGMLILKINRTIRKIAGKIPEEQKLIVSGIERISRNWLLVKALRTNNQEYEALTKNIHNYYQHFIKAKLWSNLGSTIPLLLGILPLIIIIFVSRELWQTPVLTLIVFLLIFSRFLYLFSRWARFLGLANSLYPSFKIAINYAHSFSEQERKEALTPLTLNKPDQNYSLGDNWQSTAPSSIIEGKISSSLAHSQEIRQIKLNNLFFAYTPHSNWILENFSFTINHGEQIGLIGKSGSGKSSLIGLIIGVLEPTKGSITVDGIKAADFFDQPSTRIGYVGSEPFLIEGTIKDNLDYGAHNYYESEDYRQALAQASLLEVIDSLPNGLDYWITENGEGLSAGQKQRLCLARALLCQPQLLILDEPSANLDEQTEAEITTSVKDLKGKCTVIIASHKPGILKFVDQKIDLSPK